MSGMLDKMLANLTGQRQAMVEDNVEQVLNYIEEQELLAAQLNSFLGAVSDLNDEQKEKLQEIAALVESNKLLAQQSLAFSRKMLRLLSGEEAYSGDGNMTAPRAKNIRLDIRA